MRKRCSSSLSYTTVFIDTNVFYNILFGTEYADESQRILKTKTFARSL